MALTDTLDDLISERRIEPQLAMKILANFDRSITEVLAEKVKARLSFKVYQYLFAVSHLYDPLWMSQEAIRIEGIQGNISDGLANMKLFRVILTPTVFATKSGLSSSKMSPSKWKTTRTSRSIRSRLSAVTASGLVRLERWSIALRYDMRSKSTIQHYSSEVGWGQTATTFTE